MQVLPELFNNLRVRKSCFSGCCLGLCNGKLSKEIYPCYKFFIMINAHNNETSLTVLSQINRSILLMTHCGNFSCLISKTGYWFYYWHFCTSG